MQVSASEFDLVGLIVTRTLAKFATLQEPYAHIATRLTSRIAGRDLESGEKILAIVREAIASETPVAHNTQLQGDQGSHADA